MYFIFVTDGLFIKKLNHVTVAACGNILKITGFSKYQYLNLGSGVPNVKLKRSCILHVVRITCPVSHHLKSYQTGHILHQLKNQKYPKYDSMSLMEILKKHGEPYSVKALLEGVPKTFSTPEIRVDCPDEVKFTVADKMKPFFSDYPVIDIDGIRINFPDGWGLVRASNTQPALVLRFESLSGKRLEEIRNDIESVLKTIIKETT